MEKFKECCTTTLKLFPTAKCCCDCGSSIGSPITEAQYNELYNMFSEIAENQKEYYQVRGYDTYLKTIIIDVALDVKEKTLSITLQSTKCRFSLDKSFKSLDYILEEKEPHTKTLNLNDIYFTGDLTKDYALSLFYNAIGYNPNARIITRKFTSAYNKAQKLTEWLAQLKV